MSPRTLAMRSIAILPACCATTCAANELASLFQDAEQIAVIVGPHPQLVSRQQLRSGAADRRLLEKLVIARDQDPGGTELADVVLVICIDHTGLLGERVGGQLHDGLEV